MMSKSLTTALNLTFKIWLVSTRVVWISTWIQEITVSHQASNFLPTVCFETLRRYPSEMKGRTAADLLLSRRLIKITSKEKALASRKWRGASQIHLHPQLTLVQLTLWLRKALITRGHVLQGWAKSDSGSSKQQLLGDRKLRCRGDESEKPK